MVCVRIKQRLLLNKKADSPGQRKCTWLAVTSEWGSVVNPV